MLLFEYLIFLAFVTKGRYCFQISPENLLYASLLVFIKLEHKLFILITCLPFCKISYWIKGETSFSQGRLSSKWKNGLRFFSTIQNIICFSAMNFMYHFSLLATFNVFFSLTMLLKIRCGNGLLSANSSKFYAGTFPPPMYQFLINGKYFFSADNQDTIPLKSSLYLYLTLFWAQAMHKLYFKNIGRSKVLYTICKIERTIFLWNLFWDILYQPVFLFSWILASLKNYSTGEIIEPLEILGKLRLTPGILFWDVSFSISHQSCFVYTWATWLVYYLW